VSVGCTDFSKGHGILEMGLISWSFKPNGLEVPENNSISVGCEEGKGLGSPYCFASPASNNTGDTVPKWTPRAA
jgi:hypothetical protein